METFTKNDWQEFLDGKIAVNCPTEELAKKFINSEKVTQHWDWKGETYWNDHKDSTTYLIYFGLTFSSLDFVKTREHIIKEFKGWDEFEEKESVEKPPLGVMPKYLYEEERIRDLCRALHEYTKDMVDLKIIKTIEPWVDELLGRLAVLEFELESK